MRGFQLILRTLLLSFTLLIASTVVNSATEVSAPTRVLDISVGSLDGRIAAAVTFSAPLNSKTDLSQWLSISNEQGSELTGAWVLGDKAKVLYFTNIEPEQSYRVTVKKGLPLEKWQLLEQGAGESIEVAAISPMLGFAGNGNLIAATLSDGLPVLSVNVPEVDVDFFRIPKSQLVSFLSENSRRGQLEFWQAERYLESIELVYSARFDLKLLRNQSATSYLPIKQIAPLQQQGVYLAVMRQTGSYSYNYPVTWFAVSDLGVHIRLYPQGASVSVSSLEGAEPQGNVNLLLLDAQGKEVAAEQTDENGLAKFNAQQLAKAQLLLAFKGNQTSLVRLFGPALDLAEFPIEGITSSPQRLFFYSERDLYRPGEQVRISALLRDSDGKMLPEQVLSFVLKQPDGKLVNQQRVNPSELGYYQSDWQLPQDAPTGQWSVNVKTADGQNTQYQIQVEEFLPERMELTLDAPALLSRAEPLIVKVDGQFLYGAPAAGNILQSELISRNAAHPFTQFADFYFSNPQITDYNRRESLEDQPLNARGELTLAPPLKWQQAATPLQLSLFASLLDSGGRPVSRSTNSYVLPAAQLVGIRPLFEKNTAPYDSNANFEIVLSDGKQRLASDPLTVRLVREQRNYHWVYNEGEGWRSDYTERHYVVSTDKVVMSADQSVKVSLPVEWGHYRLEVENSVTKLISGYRFRAGWSADETVMAGRPDRIGLALDRVSYRSGDRVKVEIKAPAPGRGYLLVESDEELLRLPIDVAQEGAQVSFDLDPAWQSHNLYVSVFLLQPGDKRDQRLPRRMMGIAPLPLDRSARQLEIDIDTAQKVQPNQKLIVPITVRRADGKIPQGKVSLTLAAVDVGVLNISRFVTPDPFSGFFAQRAYTAKARDSYADLINADAGVLAELKFGGDQDNIQGSEADAKVQIVSLFSGTVEVDSKGVAQVPLAIPDFNGRLRLMALAFSAESFGSQQQELEVAAPIVTQLTKPRFLRSGDRAVMALDLDNLSGIAQSLNVELGLGQGLRFDSKESGFSDDKFQQSLSLAVGQKKTLYFPLAADSDYRAVDIKLNIKEMKTELALAPRELSRQWQLQVHPSWARSDLQWQQVIAPGEKFTLQPDALEGYIASSLRGQLNLSAEPPLDIASHFSALKAYPYGCLEQTTSGVFPQLYVSDPLLAQLGISGSNAEQRSASISLAIQRLLGMQRSNGGFGLWSDQSEEEHWLSVYVLDFMLRARTQGYAVPQEGLAKAEKRVAAYLRNPEKISSYDQEISEREKVSVRSYAAQVLAREGKAPLSILRRIFDRNRELATPMSLIQLGLALNASGDHVRGEESIAIASAKLDRFGKEHNRYGSAVRDLALSSYWLLEAKHSGWQPLLLSLVPYLAQREWLSTQERNALFLLGSALQQHKGAKISFSLSSVQQSIEKTLEKLNKPLNSQTLLAGLDVTNQGENPLYLNLRSQGYTAHAPQPQNKGINVQRRYYNLSGDPVNIDQVRSGEKFIVELNVVAQQRTRQALVVDLLPAGFEIENQNLADSYQQNDLKVEGHSISQMLAEVDIKHQEYREDRYVAALNLPAKQVQRLYYIVRAVSRGVFAVPPTFAEDMYRPQIRHNGEGNKTVTVLAR